MTLRERFPILFRLLVFGSVGVSGIAVDLGTLNTLLALAVPFGTARGASILLAMTWNFALHRTMTYRDRASRSLIRQFVAFVSACLVGAVVNWGVSQCLVTWHSYFAQNRLLAAVAGIVAGFAFNFLLCHAFVFRRTDDEEPKPREGPDVPAVRGLQAEPDVPRAPVLPIQHN